MTYTADVSMFPYFKNEKMEKLKKERNAFEYEFHKSLDCQVKQEEQYEDIIEKLKVKNEILQEELKLKDIELNEQSDNICAILESRKELRKANEILRMENVSLKEFREKAEDECEASAITELFMNQIEELKNQVESLKEKEEELKNLHKYVESKQDLVFEFICGAQDNTFEDQIDYLKENIWEELPRGLANDLILFGMVDNPSKSNYDFCSEDYFREQVCDIDNIENWRKWLEGDVVDFIDENNDDEEFEGTFEEMEQNQQLLENFMNDYDTKDQYVQWYCGYKNIDYIYMESSYSEYVVFIKEN